MKSTPRACDRGSCDPLVPGAGLLNQPRGCPFLCAIGEGVFFEMGSHHVAQAGLALPALFAPYGTFVMADGPGLEDHRGRCRSVCDLF